MNPARGPEPALQGEERAGGQFAVGEALVAETMLVLARHSALGVVQAFSAVANMIAASVGLATTKFPQSRRPLYQEWPHASQR